LPCHPEDKNFTETPEHDEKPGFQQKRRKNASGYPAKTVENIEFLIFKQVVFYILPFCKIFLYPGI